MGPFTHAVLNRRAPFPLPILTFPGAALTGSTVRAMVTSADAQIAAQLAIHARFGTPCLMSAMDLSVEAEEFGSEIRFDDAEVPTVINRLVTDATEIESLEVPVLGRQRTPVYLDTIRGLLVSPGSPIVLAGMIGPLSLAGRLFGVSEALLATATDPEMILELIEKATRFLLSYARAFKEAGAHGVIIAEPAAGLLSPSSLGTFSTPYLRTIVEDVQDDSFDVILHNCGARSAHLAQTFGAGAAAYHFGSPMDLTAALREAPEAAIICGNLDPARVFHDGTPQEVRARTEELLAFSATHPRFVISSGCDIPGRTPIPNLEAFFSVVSQGR